MERLISSLAADCSSAAAAMERTWSLASSTRPTMRSRDWPEVSASSVAAAMVVSRVGKEEDLGQQIVGQVFDSPKVLGISALVLFLLGIIPGMPNVVFLSFAFVIGGIAFWIGWQQRQAQAASAHVSANAAHVILSF